MVLDAIISYSFFNINGVEFTCMATWLPYKNMFADNQEFPVANITRVA